VVASMGDYAASGGYWIAMDADRIYANPSTVTGSIGIFGLVPTVQRSLDRIGVHTDGVGTTRFAGAFDITRAGSGGRGGGAVGDRGRLPGLHRPRRAGARHGRGGSGRGRARP